MKRLLVLAVLAAQVAFAVPPPPKPDWDGDDEQHRPHPCSHFAPQSSRCSGDMPMHEPGDPHDMHEPGDPHDHDPFFGEPPPPKPGEHTDALVVGAFASLACLVLLVLLLRASGRDRREATKKLSMLANVSHEFRTPLTNLRLYAELLQNVPDMPADVRDKYLGVIALESERLARLVDNVLDYGRLAERRRTFAKESVDLPRILRVEMERFSAKAEAAGVVVSLVGLEEAAVVADSEAVRIVAGNLIDNAIKYGAAGKSIVIRVGKDDHGTFFEVTDHGCGIPEKDAKRIFKRFFRSGEAIESRTGGTGLGLDISRGLMRGMGGSLDYRPNPSGGCIFRATFPV